MNSRHLRLAAVCLVMTMALHLPIVHGQVDKTTLIGHWKLDGDARDGSDAGLDGRTRQLAFLSGGPHRSTRASAHFNGRSSLVELPARDVLRLGKDAFTVAMWIHTESDLDDTLGDLISKYDPATRRGFSLTIQNHAGVTSAQSNYRHLSFGIDDGKIDDSWTDCGRPGNNLFVFALCVFQGQLFAGTFEHGKDEAGHVYRYGGGQEWIDCGQPDKCNSVQALAVYNGKLYAGVGRYLARGSSLPESPNEIPGGKVYRYEGDGNWIDCGQLSNDETGEAFTVGGMAVYRGQLFAGVSKPDGRGLYRYDGDRDWDYLGNPGHRVTNPVVYNGKMYFCSLDGGGVARYDGDSTWTDVGKPEGVTQTYGFAVHEGQLYASSWPNGEVFRYAGGQRWTSTGRLGTEKEVMGMAVYNGKLYAGTLPLAEVYRFDGGTNWSNTGQLDKTPDVRYRRAWSMAVYQGKLYCGTLPSGRVYSLEAGKTVTYDHALPAGWVHIAAVRDASELRLFLNGKRVARTAFRGQFDISNDMPLKIGFGPHDYFNGRMSDLRMYRQALNDEEVKRLAERR